MPGKQVISSTSLTPTQFWILVRENRRASVLAGLAGALLMFVACLFEVPYFTSTAKLQFKIADTGKTVIATVLNEADGLGVKEFMDRSVDVVRSDSFHEELAALVKSSEERDRLVLAWAVGARLRLQYARARLGIGEVHYEKIPVEELSQEEIAALLGKMISIIPDYKMQSADVSISALDGPTAERVNSLVIRALINTNEKIKAREMDKAIDFLEQQKNAARKKLAEANDNLQIFYHEHPEMIGLGTRPTAEDERTALVSQRDRVRESLQSNRKLLDFYRQKYASFGKDSDSTAEVFNKFKQELIELKYRRKKYIFQGYDEKNEGIVELDKKIAETEKILAGAGADANGAKHLVGVGHDQNLSEKILELQESIKKQEFEAESIEARLSKMSSKSHNLSQSMLLLENLKGDVRMNTELFEELNKKVEYAQMRRNGDEQQILVKESPSLPLTSSGAPLRWRILFAFIVGMAVHTSWLILSMLFSTKIIDWQNVEDFGVNFAGVLREYDPDLAEILTNLDCLDRPDHVETPIVLCAAPENSVSQAELHLLTSYLASHEEKSLLTVVGQSTVLPNYRLTSDIGFAKVYTSANEKEFVLQITERESIKSLREVVKILEENYRLRYSCVFLFFTEGVADANYYVGLKMASKVLLLGRPARYTAAQYLNLLKGIKDLRIANFAFVDLRRAARRARSNRPRRAHRGAAPANYRSPTLPERVRDIFFDP